MSECLIPGVEILHESEVLKLTFSHYQEKKSCNFLLILILDTKVKNLKSFRRDYQHFQC